MFYEVDFTIPANTQQSSPSFQLVPVAAGRLTRVEVQFPLGCKGLVHVQLRRELYQFGPRNLDGDLKADNAIIAWDEDLLIDQPPLAIRMYGWNADDSYNHTVTLRLTIGTVGVAVASPGVLQRIRESLGV